MIQPQAVVFDLGKVLVDFDYSIAARRIAERSVAEPAAVQGFLSDYYATPDTWSIQSAGERVVTAINHWLHGRGQAHAENQGWLTTFTALVLRGRSAHILHIGHEIAHH